MDRVKSIEALHDDWWKVILENDEEFTYRSKTKPFEVGQAVLFEEDENCVDVNVQLIRPVDSHAHFYVYINGARAGKLCFSRDEWEALVACKKMQINHIVS